MADKVADPVEQKLSNIELLCEGLAQELGQPFPDGGEHITQTIILKNLCFMMRDLVRIIKEGRR
jgi:hypothetical protein